MLISLKLYNVILNHCLLWNVIFPISFLVGTLDAWKAWGRTALPAFPWLSLAPPLGPLCPIPLFLPACPTTDIHTCHCSRPLSLTPTTFPCSSVNCFSRASFMMAVPSTHKFSHSGQAKCSNERALISSTTSLNNGEHFLLFFYVCVTCLFNICLPIFPAGT